MGKYVNAVDLADPSLVITESHCAEADVFVDSQLWEREIDPADITLPNTLLTSIAGYWAKREAALEGAVGVETILFKKSVEFEKNAVRLAATISRKSLGIETSSSYGSITIGRG